MQRILSHRVYVDGRRLPGLTLVTATDDGMFISAAPFCNETAGTSFTDGKITVTDSKIHVQPASACNDCLQPDFLNLNPRK